MKYLFVITIVSISIFGCSSGNQNTGEATTESADSKSGDSVSAAETTSIQDSASEIQSSTESSGALDELRMGMTEDEVVGKLGEPTKRETIGNDPKVAAEDWWYGENQKVRMINHKVNNVVKDINHQNELLQQLMAAKKNKDEAEVKRIMDELTKDQK